MSHIDHFSQLGLSGQVLSALNTLGFNEPTPIQAESIPVLLEGSDILAQAQTGTGKTAAFSLPILSQIELDLRAPQALIIAPTRELALQVTDAIKDYSQHMKGLQVTSIYGGQDYRTQLRALKSGSHIVVGTPGRIMDHMRRGTLSVDNIQTLVLDEADEMLKMGFREDMEWIMEQMQHQHQTALFSATIPEDIKNISNKFLNHPVHVRIKPKTVTVEAITQHAMCISNYNKLNALMGYLALEDTDATIIFTRTKTMCTELAEKLQSKGYNAAALNGDMSQSVREKVIERVKKGSLDIIIATDVAARGIDVPRISHVINYDIPYDSESYIHRIGRTGRAGREGKALLFVNPKEYRLLKGIERDIKRPIELTEPPTAKALKQKNIERLTEQVTRVLSSERAMEKFTTIAEQIMTHADCEVDELAIALTAILQRDNVFSIEAVRSEKFSRPQDRGRRSNGNGGNRRDHGRKGHQSRRDRFSKDRKPRRSSRQG